MTAPLGRQRLAVEEECLVINRRDYCRAVWLLDGLERPAARLAQLGRAVRRRVGVPLEEEQVGHAEGVASDQVRQQPFLCAFRVELHDDLPSASLVQMTVHKVDEHRQVNRRHASAVQAYWQTRAVARRPQSDVVDLLAAARHAALILYGGEPRVDVGSRLAQPEHAKARRAQRRLYRPKPLRVPRVGLDADCAHTTTRLCAKVLLKDGQHLRGGVPEGATLGDYARGDLLGCRLVVEFEAARERSELRVPAHV